MLALILVTKADVPKEFSNSTLIGGRYICLASPCHLSDLVIRLVAPLSVLSNWEKQIDDHCEKHALSYFVYYGSKRDIDPKELQKFDVVITTYQTVAGEYEAADSAGPSKKKKKIERSLFEIQWKVSYIMNVGRSVS